MKQANAFALLRGEPLELETRFREIEYSPRHVHADDLCELVIGQEPTQELTLATPQIEDTRSAGSLHYVEHGVEPTFVETDRPLNRRFLLVLLGCNGFLFRLFLGRQSRDGLTNEPSLVHQITRDDDVARRMAVEPPLPMTKQL